MKTFSAPSWDVDENSEKLARNFLGGNDSSKNNKKKRVKKNRVQQNTNGILNSSPSSKSQIKTKSLGGLTKTLKLKNGLKKKSSKDKMSKALKRKISQSADVSHIILEHTSLKKKGPQEPTSAAEAGISVVNSSHISPKKGKNKKNKKNKIKLNAENVVDSRSKMERLFEVEKKRKKVKKIKEAQVTKPSISSVKTEMSPSVTAIDKKLKRKLKKKEQKKKKMAAALALAKEKLNSHEVVLNRKEKKAMLKAAKKVSEGEKGKKPPQLLVEGTANPSFDTSKINPVSENKKHINSKKTLKKSKKKVSTDSVDGKFLSTIKQYKLGSKIKKGTLPGSSVSNMVPDKLAKKKLSVSKLLQKAAILDPSASVELKKRGLEVPALDSTISYDVKQTRKLKRDGAFNGPSSSSPVTPNSPKNAKQKKAPLSLKEKMLEQLKSARFRWLNEQLYCSNSWDAAKYFKEDPDAYEAYHSGYRNQVAQWPVNPVEIIIKSISSLPSDIVVADFGCGDAHLAASLPDRKVHSLDLVASKPGIVACDMAHTPLLMDSVDVAVFCLSLMGTNLNDFILEANRVLKIGGMLYIAEVESRFEDIDNFTSAMVHFGFTLKKKDVDHQMFIFMDFKKSKKVNKSGKLPELTLEPCIYKRR